MRSEMVGDTCLLTFDSVDEMVEMSEKFGDRVDTYRRAKFVGRGFSSWYEVMQAARTTYKPDMDRFDQMMEQLRDAELPRPSSLKRRGLWSEEAGDEVDVDRLRRGAPYWRTTRRDHRPGPVSATILTNISTPCFRKSDTILWRGAAGVCLTHILEQAGYRVELWAVNNATTGYQNGDGAAQAVCLKRPSDPLDASGLITAVSGWFFRTMFFASYHHHHAPPKHHYGFPSAINSIAKTITPDEQHYICDGVWSQHEAVNWVHAQLRQIINS